MISEAYVSFETAKLLKEKGFDVPCLAHWYIGSEAWEEFSDHPFNWNEVKSDLDWLSRPTQQMAMKWLREVYKILILVEYDCPVFSSDIYKMDDIDEYGSAKHISPTFANCKNYEQACKAAIKYCLENLI